MRFDGSSQFLARKAKVDVAFGEKVIPAGQIVFVVLAAANRDGRQFKNSEGVANPDMFDIRRPISRHLGFGAGRHTCLGGPLAERLAEVAVLLFLKMFPDYQVTVPYEQLPWKSLHSNVRCVEHMPVRLKASL
jgi:cytochrome P450